MLVFQVLGPHLVCTFRKHIFAIHKSIKSLVRQMALGISFLHHCGVVHAGSPFVLLADWKAYESDLDLYNANIAFEIPDLDGEPEEDVMNALGAPTCTAVLTRDQMDQTDSLPRYVVAPENLLCRVQKDNLRIKITDLGGGLSVASIVSVNINVPQRSSAPKHLVTCVVHWNFKRRRLSSMGYRSCLGSDIPRKWMSGPWDVWYGSKNPACYY